MDNKRFPLIVRRQQIKDLVGISPTTASRLESDPSSGFPRRKAWGPKICGWSGEELQRWVNERGQVIRCKNPVAGKQVKGGYLG
jgi:predicted DNA-binding transcriptional regulator AlpA